MNTTTSISNRRHHPPPHVSRPRSVPAMKPAAPCAVTLPAHQPHASHRHPLRSTCRHPAECRLESHHAACATSRLSAHPAPTCGAMREASRTTLVLACPRPAVTRARGTIPPPLGVAACRACHAPDAAMFPLGGRRASRAPFRDHSRPIQPTSCRDARRLAPANPRPPRSLLPTSPPSSIQPRAHPAPAAPTASPAPKDRPRRSSLRHGITQRR